MWISYSLWISWISIFRQTVHRLPDKSSAADPLPTSLLKQVADIIAPFTVQLIDRSLADGLFPAVCKEAFMTPIVKKLGLDDTDVKHPDGHRRVSERLFILAGSRSARCLHTPLQMGGELRRQIRN